MKKAIREAKSIAKQLCYPHSVLVRLDACKTETEIQRVLIDARRNLK